ncbi:MAG: inosine/xanthosine triphosphatase [Anaerolineaceae bacterium]|nr:inosine/xanthosine triphosphatase [Anaerolineaceae bacterium]
MVWSGAAVYRRAVLRRSAGVYRLNAGSGGGACCIRAVRHLQSDHAGRVGVVKTIVVASQNPVKIAAARQGFNQLFPGETVTVTGVNVPSGVSDQPMSDAETYQGARNRAQAARDAQPGADYWMGIEGGLTDWDGDLLAFAWIVVLAGDLVSHSRTATFSLPQEIVTLIRQGIELGEADDIVFRRNNSKQGNGAVGILTGDIIDRTGYYAHAVMLALIPFKNPDLTFQR